MTQEADASILLSEAELLQEWIDSARYGDLEYMSQIISECRERSLPAPIHWKTSTGNTALHMACANGHINTVSFLLDNHASCSVQNDQGNSALHWAAMNGHLDVVELLLKHDAPIDLHNKAGYSAMFEAQRNNHENVVKCLLCAFPEPKLESSPVLLDE
jgi:ankyrin repeat protein